jgi:DNA-binding response OmpR family regulator
MNFESAAAKRSEQRLVFVVEDNTEIAALISLALGKAGFATRIFHDGGSALEALPTQPPALILLDRMLPDIEGLEILRCLKGDESLRYIKTIVVSARTSESDKVRALDLGVDDYISKPFSPRELVARVRAVLRSEREASAHRVLQLGSILTDLDSRRIIVDGGEVVCSTREFELLVCFMHNPGQTLSRRQLLDRVWPEKAQTLDDRIVDVYVRRLREKIEADASNPTRLLTRRGGGYTLVVPV